MLTALGLTPDSDRLYRLMLGDPDLGVADLAERLDWAPEQVRAALDQLADLSLLEAGTGPGGRLRVITPQLALEALYAQQQAEVARRQMELTASRAAAAELLKSYAAASPDPATTEVERLVGLDAVRRRLTALTDGARRETMGFAPGGPQTPENRAASRPLSEQLAARGVVSRTIYLDSLRNDPGSVEHARWLLSLDHRIRVVPSLPMRMFVVDARTALAPLDPEDSSRGAVVIEEPGAVAAFVALFESVWATAVPFGTPLKRDLHDPGSQYRELLRLLAQGCTDEAAARRLGVSLRTERRLISDLMERLDARSRFQLGQRAMELGLL
ncbi:helix-turn-helix transcriptional regulator [Streptomyces sp. NPDC060194]|uniref:helix-turn-helix transcriptional regulator n=1 Tax=Streptomyces sp. NPDC060194 TaxID=3347069 RepID=UPI00364B2B93